MITAYRKNTLIKDKAELELRGLSTDSKPTEDVANGTTFIEMDTGKIYMYDLENEEWKEI